MLLSGAFDRAYADAPDAALVDFGRALFFDPNLSLNRTQSCATCHDPARAFVDSRDNGVGGAVSLGDDGRSLGDRNAPSLTYAALTPPLRRNADGVYEGGLFHDGRARDLADQAGQPILNPLEMNMPDAAAVAARVSENPAYVATLRELGVTDSGCDVCRGARRARCVRADGVLLDLRFALRPRAARRIVAHAAKRNSAACCSSRR